MQVGTYPTRNFAQGCYKTIHLRDWSRTDHFCQSLRVATQLGLYLGSPEGESWRIVSEDFIAFSNVAR